MTVFKCKMCGGSLEVKEGESIVTCQFCGVKQTIPKLENDFINSLYIRANDLRLNGDFDRAEEIYEIIIEQSKNEPEAYWGKLLCMHGVEYVKDPKTGKRIPTCHKLVRSSIISELDFKLLIEYASPEQKEIYTNEALQIDKIQKATIKIANNEKPYDIFICYKETDDKGNKTNDYLIANDIYERLTEKGYRVFFAAISLEDKLGYEYEPYIYSALISSKVMLVIGTNPDYLESTWVKNEWSRFLKLSLKDKTKVLIPCYKNMGPYDLPKEFHILQAQDMSKINFYNDLIRGIDKLFNNDNKNKYNEIKETKEIKKTSTNKLILLPIIIFSIILIVLFGMNTNYVKYELAKINFNNHNYVKAIKSYNELINYKESKEYLYQIAVNYYNFSNYDEAKQIFDSLSSYKYKDTEKYLKYISLKNLNVGDIIEIGTYEQDNILTNGKEPIEWIVLEVSNNRALLISKYILECKEFNDKYIPITYNDSTIREWLNNDFYISAFSQDDMQLLDTITVSSSYNYQYNTYQDSSTIDTVFLLSNEEVENYFSNNSNNIKCKPTNYAKNSKLYTDPVTGYAIWWLRTPGQIYEHATSVYDQGYINYSGDYVSSYDIGVRPAIWINIGD